MLVSFAAFAQQFGNEWIDFSNNQNYSKQQYYKIRVWKDGLYRVYAADLIKAGIIVKTDTTPNAPIDARWLQLFDNGKEQALFMNNQSGGAFLNNGYLEFYGKKNDGALDAELYISDVTGLPDPKAQGNPYYSLVSDTATYFITWNNSLNNLRYDLQQDVNFAGHTKANYFVAEHKEVYTSSYFMGGYDDFGVPDPEYTTGEGYGNWFQTNGGATATMLVSGAPPKVNMANLVANTGVKAAFSTNVIGSNNAPNFIDPITLSNNNHQLTIRINGKTYIDTTFHDFALINRSFQLNTSDLKAGDNFVEIMANWKNGAPANDAKNVAYFTLSFPRDYNFTGDPQNTQLMAVPDGPDGNKAYIEILGFYDNGTAPILYDLQNRHYITLVKNAGVIQALIPNTNGLKNCFLASESQVNIVKDYDLKPVSYNNTHFAKFTNYEINEANKDYLIISHPKLWDAAGDYKKYREQTGSKVLLADIIELYDQFAYGITQHPLAIRHFADFVLTKWTTKPQHLLLLGKSVKSDQWRKNYDIQKGNLVTTIGFPGADNMLVSRIQGSSWAPAIAIGRVSARNPKEAYDYLNKLQEYESNKADEWMKEAIHLAGGKQESESRDFKEHYLDYWGHYLQDSLYGAHITTYSKSASGPQVNYSEALKNRVENGASIINFLGHSSRILFDNSLDEPQNYNIKKGRYSFFISNGCYSGDIHDYLGSNSEVYVLTAEKGSIGFLAASYLANTFGLNPYNSQLYYAIANVKYGKSIGQAIQYAVKALEPGKNAPAKQVCLEMNLEGDPAVVINAHEKPDLMINSNNRVYFSPANVATDIDSFKVNIISTNIGRTFNTSYFINLKRTFGDNSKDTTYRILAKPVYFKDTIVIKLPVDKKRGPGINHFDVFLDSNFQLDEIAVKHEEGENNNTTSADLFIQTKEVLAIIPPRYGIVPNNKVKLIGLTGTFNTPAADYAFEIDTTENFTNPLLQSTVNGPGEIITWEPNIVLKDSVVYYWRISLKSANNWATSSFTYIPGKTGWSQSHAQQLKNDTYVNTAYDLQKRQTNFVKETKGIRAETHGDNAIGPNGIGVGKDYNSYCGYYVNNQNNAGGTFISRGLMFAVINGIDGSVWESIAQGGSKGQYGDYHPGGGKIPVFQFPMGGASDSLGSHLRVAKFLDTIPQGHYLLMYSIGRPLMPEYSSRLKKAFQKFGVADITSYPDSVPIIIFGQKGSGNQAHIVRGKVRSDIITLSDSAVFNYFEGNVLTPLVGPAKKWGNLTWRQKTLDKPINKDTVRLSVVGIDRLGYQKTLISKLPPDSSNVALLSRIDAAQYPYLKLNMFVQDSALRTPAQLVNWRVYYEAVPEASLNTAINYFLNKDTLQEGEILKFSTAFENISPQNMDSLRVKVWVMDKNNIQHLLSNDKRKPLLADGSVPNDTINVSAIFDTKGYPGINTLWIQINPNFEQPEQYDFNNFYSKSFLVIGDKINPLLDVTFDGLHILNGDIVPSNPNIQIRLKDENKFLVLNDTSRFKVYLMPPGEEFQPQQRLNFSNPSNPNKYLRFTPGSTTNNLATIDFSPILTKDGVYTLVVQAQDIAGNASGQTDYRITFEVINKSTISEVMNYPNPFSSSTRFVFTLTGSQSDIPQGMKIQIMTISGKIVREIMQSELGPIHIGRNITEYAWDGKDEFGDVLANGVYVYRVATTLRGQAIEKRESGADKYFVKGYGKMYLMR
jgi:hypothetical protein